MSVTAGTSVPEALRPWGGSRVAASTRHGKGGGATLPPAKVRRITDSLLA